METDDPPAQIPPEHVVSQVIPQQINALMAAIPGVVYQFLMCPDGSWRFPYLSPGVETLYGLAAEAVYANPEALNFCLLPEDRPAHWASVEQACQTLTPWRHEHRVQPHGQPDQLKWVRGQATPSPQPDGSILWNGILTDITGEKRTEAALSAGKQQLDMALRAATMGVWDWEIATGRVTWAGEHAALFGIPLADFGGTIDDVQIHVHPDDRTRGLDVFRRTVEEGIDFDNTYRVVWPDGSLHWLHSLGSLVHDEFGEPQRIVGTTQDITARKGAEEIQREALSRLRKIASRLPGVIYEYRLSPDGRSCCPFVSEALRDIFRLDPAAVREDVSRVFARIHPDDHDRVRASFEESARHLTPRHQEYRLQFDDGQVRWMLGDSVPEREADGSILWHGFVTDITERKQAEAMLHRSRTMLARTEAITHIGSWEWEVATDTVIWSDELFRIFQRDPAEGAPSYAEHSRIYVPEDMRQLNDAVTAAVNQGTPYALELRALRRDGATRILAVIGEAGLDQERRVTHLFGSVQDITQRKWAEQSLRDSEARYRALFDQISSGVAIYEARDDGRGFVFTDFNPAAERIDGERREDLIGKSLSEERPGAAAFGLPEVLRRVWSTGEPERFPARLYQDERLAKWYENSVYRLPNGEIVAVFDDVTRLKEHELELERIAYFDALTGLPNRVLLTDRLCQAMLHSRRHEQPLALVYLDLDGFKAINDRHGHHAGDQLLIALAERMKQVLREGDTLTRLGGDEFVAVLIDLVDYDAIVPLLNRLRAAVAAPVPFGGRVMQVSASLGVTFYPQTDDVDGEQLLRQADQSMYQAKRDGKNRYHLFNHEQERGVRRHHDRLERIRHGLAADEFVLYYQPKVNLRLGTVVGVEALIRWQHPELGFLEPMQFLPAIEDDRVAVELGEWVIDRALTQMEDWQASGLELPVSVNIGALQLQQADFVKRLRDLLAAHPAVKPCNLALEILETSVLGDLAHVFQVVAECHEMGVSFALDDFGTGYSSLTHLKHLPVHLLKIDQSFVRDMLYNPDDLAIIKSVLTLAAAFHRQAIAEGMETLEHGAMLLSLGCDLAQGYGIAHPLPAHALPGWLAAWRPDPNWAQRPEIDAE
jgi:diguanylate cyclase (GGDEF)-like protein/PAS domain S-box-containing protein